MAPLPTDKSSDSLVPAISESDPQESRREVTVETIAADLHRLHSLYRDTESPSDAALPSGFNTLPDYRTAGYITGSYGQGGPSLLPRDGGINGSGLSPVGAALLALGGVAAVGVAGLLVHSKFDDSRDRKKAALTQRQRGEAQEPTEPDPRASTRSRIRSAKESLSAICHTNRSKSAPRTEPVSQPHPEIELDIMAPPHIHGRSERLP